MKQLIKYLHDKLYGTAAIGTHVNELPNGFRHVYPEQVLPYNEWVTMIQKEQELAKH